MFRNLWQPRAIETEQFPLDGLHGEPQFRAILDVERMRVHRGAAGFALAVFDFGHDEEHFRLFAQYLSKRIRSTDHAGLLGGYRLGVVLFHTGRAGAAKFVESLTSVAENWTHPDCEIYVYPWEETDSPNENDTLEAQLLEEVRATSELLDGERRDDDQPKKPAKPVAQPETVNSTDKSPETMTAAVGQSPEAQPMDGWFVRPVPAWKMVLDKCSAAIGLLVLTPLFLIAAIAIKLTSNGPVFFVQRRTGQGGRKFSMFKFRTMSVNAEAQQAALRSQSEQDGPAFKMTNDPRVTKLGRFLRKSCIDELPQLVNVLRGDMTLVGPRPLPCDEQARAEAWQQQRLDVRPGLTCIWQVYGKSKVNFTDWMRMDMRYINSRSFVTDCQLIFRTIWSMALSRANC